jgi:hypothetical protein
VILRGPVSGTTTMSRCSTRMWVNFGDLYGVSCSSLILGFRDYLKLSEVIYKYL